MSIESRKADRSADSPGSDEAPGRRRSAGTAAERERGRLVRGRRLVLLLTALCGALILLGPTVRVADDAAGLWLMIGAPCCVYFGLARRVLSTVDAAALLTVGLALLHDLVLLLLLDLLLPLCGDAHPLELRPIAVAITLGTVLVGAFAPEAEPLTPGAFARHRRGLIPVLAGGAAAILLSIAGAIRLNNGFGSGVSIAAMVVVVGFLFLLLSQTGYSLAVIELGIYFAAAAILLLTSLRGWLLTGHDIQTEYAYFSDVFASGRWQPGKFQNAYYSCLSVTLLPVGFAHLTDISVLYIFKVVEPLLFAVTPVLLFRSVRNVAPHSIAVLSSILFIIFPNFTTDMTYMSRQEIAFILVGCAMLVVTGSGARIGIRRLVFGLLMAGVVLSHYSTAYVVIMVCGVAVAGDLLLRARLRVRGRRRGGDEESGGRSTRRISRVADPDAKSVVPWWVLVATAAMAVIWAGPVTHTDGQVQTTVSAAISQLEGGASSGYFSASPTAKQLLADYQKAALQQTAPDRAKGVYWPVESISGYQTPVAGTQYQPLTGFGRWLQKAGIGVSNGNVLLRSVADRVYELFILAGLLGVWFAGRKLFRPNKEQALLALGGLGMMVVLTVVPQLSVDYGVLRAFQEGMFFFGPFMAAGFVWLAGLTRRLAKPVLVAGLTGLAAVMTGVLPQLTGGYYGIIPMANEGQYYDLHYPTENEQISAQWLESQVKADASANGYTPIVQTDFYTYDTLQTQFSGPLLQDIAPQWLRPGSYIFVGSTLVRTGEVVNRLNGQAVTYRYPMQVLDTLYNKIYANAGAEVYAPEMNN
jgi:uncharacterized membrane protein